MSKVYFPTIHTVEERVGLGMFLATIVAVDLLLPTSAAAAPQPHRIPALAPRKDSQQELIEHAPRLTARCQDEFEDTRLVCLKPPARLSGDLEGYQPGKALAFAWSEQPKAEREQVRHNAEARDAASRLPRDNLLVYRDGEAVKPVQTTDDWLKRRKEIQRGMQAVMGKLPGQEKRCPLEIKIQEEVDCGSYVRRLIEYSSEPGSRVPAYLLIPKACLRDQGTRASAILCLHPTDNTNGHKVVVGLGGRANRQYASELAERGYVTLAPSYPLLANYQPDIKRLGWGSGTLKAVWDNIRGLDVLETLPFVEKDSFGAVGHSLGGHNSIFTSVLDDRIKVVVSSCGLDSFLDYYEGDERVWLPEKGWTQTRYMPRLADYRGRLEAIPFDFHELIGALAPRHVLIVAPLEDSNFRARSVDRIVETASKVYGLYEQPSRLKVLHPACGHDFPQEMRDAAYDLFDEVLRP